VWTVDADCVLKAAYNNAGANVLTSDPALTAALFSTPTELISTGKDVTVIPLSSSSLFQLNIPLKKDSRLFVNTGAVKCSIILFVEDQPTSAD
jgi:hypothetical protein